jgi:alkylhydroperoxidase family enzyme
MSRINPLPAPYPAEIQAQFDAIMPPGAPPLVLFTTLARSDRAWRKFRAGSLLDRGPLTLRQREIVIDRVCAKAGCEYEWGVHVTAFAAAAKLTPEQIAATVSGPADAACWSEAEQALIAAVDALHARATWSAAEFEALARWHTEDQIFEILLLAGFYRTVAYIANGLALPLEPGAARFGAVSG